MRTFFQGFGLRHGQNLAVDELNLLNFLFGPIDARHLHNRRGVRGVARELHLAGLLFCHEIEPGRVEGLRPLLKGKPGFKNDETIALAAASFGLEIGY